MAGHLLGGDRAFGSCSDGETEGEAVRSREDQSPHHPNPGSWGSADGAPGPGLAQRPDAFPVTCLCAFLTVRVFLWLLLISIFRVKNVVDEGPRAPRYKSRRTLLLPHFIVKFL